MASGYDIFEGATEATIDWDSSVGHVAPGVSTIDLVGLGLFPGGDGVRWFGIRATSEAGVQDSEEAADQIVRVEISGGALVLPRPNPLLAAHAAAAADGDLSVAIVYSAQGQLGTAAGVQIAERISAEAGYDWASPLATITVRSSGVTRRTQALGGSWSHGQTVRLAARAVTSGGVAGPVTVLSPVVALAAAPAAVASAAVEAL